MKNYISINGQQIPLTEEQVEKIVAAHNQSMIRLADAKVGDVVKIAEHEMVVLEHLEGTTALIRKDLLPQNMEFGETNNYDGSYVDGACNSFSEELISAIGEENVVLHSVDLTSDDGLKDYGAVQRYASLLTAGQYRRHVAALDLHKPDRWWWLTTAYSTPSHQNDSWVKCVSPAGRIYLGGYYLGFGVRPFCILKSNIFVSK